MSVLGSAIGGGLGALGSLVGGYMNATNSKKVAKMNLDAQKEFAQNGIRWKVADAKAAGIHPLAALGAQTTSFTPSYVGDTSMGDAMSAIGQNIGRAVEATMTAKERKEAEFEQLAAQLQHNNLQNEKLQAEIDLLNAQSMSILGQPRNPPMPAVNGQSPLPTHSLYKLPDGRIVKGPNESGNQRIENWTLDNPVGFIDMLQNGFYPWTQDYVNDNVNMIKGIYNRVIPIFKHFMN